MPWRRLPESGLISPSSSFSKVVFPAPLGPMMPMRSPRMMRVEKSFSSTRAVPPKLLARSTASMTSWPPAGAASAASLARPGRRIAAGALGAQRLEPAAPAFVAAAPGGDAAQIPILLGGDALLQALGLALLALDQLLRPGLEAGEAGVELMQPAALEPEHAGREAREEGAVMADEEQRALEAQQHLLEPFDGRQVEVIGGLVQQQQIGIAGQRPGQGRAPALAARKPGGIARSVEAEAVEEGGDPMRRCPVRGDEIRQAREAGRSPAPGPARRPCRPGCRKRLPASISMLPARIFRMVDLPEPLAPTRATRSPRPMPRSISAKSGRPPKVSRAPRSAAMGGEAGMDQRP